MASNPKFSVDNLRHGIQQAEKNIKTFEDAIAKERETIGQFKWMIEQAERKEEDRKQAQAVQDNTENVVGGDNGDQR